MWFVLLVVMVTVYPIQVQSVVIVTNGPSGERCPDKRCLASRAECVNDVCLCQPPFQLFETNGNFACYRDNAVFGEVKNDPTVRNFNNETAQFQFPCRYLLTSATTNLRIRKETVGSCKCELYGFNFKYRGKFYVGGFDFACQINNTETNQRGGFSVRKEGVAENGVYTYEENSANSFLPNGRWTATALNVTTSGVNVQCSYDAVDNQARVTVLECGWAVTFVAYDIQETRNQQQIPGLSFAVNCGLEPFFLEHDRVIATAPVKFGGTLYSDLPTPPLNIAETLLIRGFTSNVVQNQEGAAPECSTVGSYLNRCSVPDRARAARNCFWMLDEPRFIRCIDPSPSASRLLRLLESCISYYCTGDPSCEEFRQNVIETNCARLTLIQEARNIQNPNFCSE